MPKPIRAVPASPVAAAPFRSHARRTFPALALAFALAMAAAGCKGAGSVDSGGERGAGPSRARNLVLISIDTLRADHLGCYGYPLATSPRLDAFAARSVLFKDCRSASGHTLSSHKAILSGRHVASILASYLAQGGPSEPIRTPLEYYERAFSGWASAPLARRLAAAGLRTIGLTDGVYMHDRYGFAEGFEEYKSRRLGLAGQRVRAEDWIEGNGMKPFFLLLHGYDVHCPYDAPERFLRLFEPACTGRLRFEGTCGKEYFNSLDLTEDDRTHLGRHYDAGIRQADEEVGRFLDFLERSGRLADTMIVITSDHGESLGERAFVGHGELYDNQLHVPLIVYVPGARPGVVTAPVAGVDIVPTVIDLLLAQAATDLDGWSLRELMESVALQSEVSEQPQKGGHAEARDAAAFASRARAAAVTVNEGRRYMTRLRKLAALGPGGLTLIHDLESGERELFDLQADPRQTRDLAPPAGRGPGAEPSGVAALEALIKSLDPGAVRGLDPSAPPSETEGLSPEALEELRSLGYAR